MSESMYSQKIPIANQKTLKNYLSPRKNIIKSSFFNSIKTNFQANSSNKSTLNAKILEDRLNEQFKYFRNEFIEAANQVGVTVPLDILEDTTGRVFMFVKFHGPKYILQMLPANTQNVHLVRCSLSLLIITVIILSRKLPDDYDSNKAITSQTNNWSNSINETIGLWAIESLNQINDAGAISVTINLMVHTNISSIHELALSFLSGLVMVSDDAAMLLFHPPNSAYQSQIKRFRQRRKLLPMMNANASTNNQIISKLLVNLSPTLRKAKKDISDIAGTVFPSNPSIKPSDNVPYDSNHSRNHSFIMSDQMNELKRIESESSYDSSNVADAKLFLRKQPKLHTDTNSLTSSSMTESIYSPNHLNLPDSVDSIPGSCLSILLSVIARNRNKYLIIGGYAELVLSICSIEIGNICVAMARMPTCHLSTDDVTRPATTSTNSRPGKLTSLNTSHKKPLSVNMSRDSFSNHNHMKIERGNHNKSVNMNHHIVNDEEWAGIKIPMMFLSRFLKYNDDEHSDYLSKRQQDEKLHTFRTILLAISHLINGSEQVANYVSELTDSIDLLSSAYEQLKDGFEDEPSNTILKSIDIIKSIIEEKQQIERFKIKSMEQRTLEIKEKHLSKLQKDHKNILMNNMSTRNQYKNPVRFPIITPSFPRRVSTAATSTASSDNQNDILDPHERIRMEYRIKRENDPTRILNTDPNSLDYLFIRSAHYAITSKSHHIDIHDDNNIKSRESNSRERIKSIDNSNNQQSTIPIIMKYSNPEYPLRRGLNDEYRLKQTINLNNDFFQSLPNIPSLPNHIGVNQMNHNHDEYQRLKTTGSEYFHNLSCKVIDHIKDNEEVIINGKSSVPLTDVYRRSYGLSLLNFNQPLFIKKSKRNHNNRELEHIVPTYAELMNINNQVLSSQSETSDSSITDTDMRVKDGIQRDVITSPSSFQSETIQYNNHQIINQYDLLSPVEAMNILGFRLENSDEDEMNHFIVNHDNQTNIHKLDMNAEDSLNNPLMISTNEENIRYLYDRGGTSDNDEEEQDEDEKDDVDVELERNEVDSSLENDLIPMLRQQSKIIDQDDESECIYDKIPVDSNIKNDCEISCEGINDKQFEMNYSAQSDEQLF